MASRHSLGICRAVLPRTYLTVEASAASSQLLQGAAINVASKDSPPDTWASAIIKGWRLAYSAHYVYLCMYL